MERHQFATDRAWFRRPTRTSLAIQGAPSGRQVNLGGVVRRSAQHLQHLYADRTNRQLNYWLRNGRASNAEVDYVAAFSGQIGPIEAKEGRTGTLKSLHQFVAEKPVPLAVGFHVEQPEVQTVNAQAKRKDGVQHVQYQLLSLPLYLVERLPYCVQALLERL